MRSGEYEQDQADEPQFIPQGNANLVRRPRKTKIFVSHRRSDSDDFLAKQVSDRLIVSRKALGKTQEEMAQMSGLGTRSAWTNYEKGYRLIPLLTVYRLCIATDLTPEWIIMGQQTHLPPELAEKIRAIQSRKPPRR